MRQDEGELLIKGSTELHNLETYRNIRAKSLHKMMPIPVFRKS